MRRLTVESDTHTRRIGGYCALIAEQLGRDAEPLAAANLLGVSPSRLRRWADEGRLEVVRTSGGHRRFPIAAVRELAADLGRRTEIRRVAPPDVPLPETARVLRADGRTLAAETLA